MMTKERLQALADVNRERDRQDQKWGGSAHDDRHTLHDWAAFIVGYVGRALSEGAWEENPYIYRANMVKVAALALASVECIDRCLPVEG